MGVLFVAVGDTSERFGYHSKMNPSSPPHPYRCLACGATGELALVVGDSACPACGKHLWTVRSQPAGAAREALLPDYRLPILQGRPPLCPKRLPLARLCVLLFRPIIILWLIPRQRVLENRVNAKLDRIADCRRRAALEQVLGKPLYAVGGEACDGPNAPDLIECYESEGCCIDLWFKDDRLIDVSGFVKPSVWDVLLSGSPTP